MEDAFIPVGRTGLCWVCSSPHCLTAAWAVSLRCGVYSRHIVCVLKRVRYYGCSTVNFKIHVAAWALTELLVSVMFEEESFSSR